MPDHRKEAEDGERILPGHAYIAPGAMHMELARSGANYVVKLNDGPPVNRHKPSVDVLFRSVAVNAGRNAVGHSDRHGQRRRGRDAGNAPRRRVDHRPDEASCVVFGMPREAIAMGGTSEVVDLGHISQHMLAKITPDRHCEFNEPVLPDKTTQE